MAPEGMVFNTVPESNLLSFQDEERVFVAFAFVAFGLTDALIHFIRIKLRPLLS